MTDSSKKSESKQSNDSNTNEKQEKIRKIWDEGGDLKGSEFTKQEIEEALWTENDEKEFVEMLGTSSDEYIKKALESIKDDPEYSSFPTTSIETQETK